MRPYSIAGLILIVLGVWLFRSTASRTSPPNEKWARWGSSPGTFATAHDFLQPICRDRGIGGGHHPGLYVSSVNGYLTRPGAMLHACVGMLIEQRMPSAAVGHGPPKRESISRCTPSLARALRACVFPGIEPGREREKVLGEGRVPCSTLAWTCLPRQCMSHGGRGTWHRRPRVSHAALPRSRFGLVFSQVSSRGRRTRKGSRRGLRASVQ